MAYLTLWQMSLSGGLLILAAALVRRFMLDRLPKKTFLILWDIVILRLLLPVSVPSVFSAWSLIMKSRTVQRSHTGTPAGILLPAASGMPIAASAAPSAAPAVLPIDAAAGIHSPDLWLALWMAGAGIFALFFLFSWFRFRRECAASLPVTEDFIRTWIENHPLPSRSRRRIRVRQSDRIRTPLTYGIFRPVILLPKTTDWKNHSQLSWILLHESVHIRRYDALTKLISAFTLCIHWFNPAVYLMYLLLNQDLELACDESVVQLSGKDSRSAYALTLIALEETRSRPLPFGSSFCRNAMKERITSIMKLHKRPLRTVFAAAALIAGITVFFTTSASGSRQTEPAASIPDTPFTEAEYKELLALRFDGYEHMSVSEYQQKVWELTDSPQYLALLERFAQDPQIEALQDTNEIASFLHHILNPLTGSRWQRRDFSGYTASGFSASSDNAVLEYTVTLSIRNAQNVTVQQYDDARVGMMEGLQTLLQNRTEEELRNEHFMEERIRQETELLISRWSTDSLQITVENFYMPLSDQTGSGHSPDADIAPDMGNTADTDTTSNTAPDRHASDTPAEDLREKREYPNATEADYRALLTLMTDDYPDLPVREFNEKILEWGNEDSSGILDRIFCDLSRNDCQVPLTSEEQAFVKTSVRLSCMENAKLVQSHYTGRPEEDPIIDEYLPPRQTADAEAYCDLYCQFFWHIPDREQLTVRQRDQAVGGLLAAVRDFWEGAGLDEILSMTKEEAVSLLEGLAREYSTDRITLSVREDGIGFETMDERGLRY